MLRRMNLLVRDFAESVNESGIRCELAIENFFTCTFDGRRTYRCGSAKNMLLKLEGCRGVLVMELKTLLFVDTVNCRKEELVTNGNINDNLSITAVRPDFAEYLNDWTKKTKMMSQKLPNPSCCDESIPFSR